MFYWCNIGFFQGAPNPLFTQFEAALNQVQKVGSRTNSFLAVDLFFFYPIARTRYYSYKGFYANTFGEIPLKYNLATIFVTPLQFCQSISINQVGKLRARLSQQYLFLITIFTTLLFCIFSLKLFKDYSQEVKIS